jgi:hypothetical protein
VKKGIILAIGLAIGGLGLLAGCKSQGDNAAGIPVGPKWKGAPYRLALDAQPAKPGVLVPAIKFTANPDALEKRAILAVRSDSVGDTKYTPPSNTIFMYPTDIAGAEGALPADYMAAANKQVAQYLTTYCIKGKVKISVALVRSSLSIGAGADEVDTKRMSDWMPIEVVFKNRNPKC